MTLATDEFIRRFLIHVLPKGLHRIRHYGLFAKGACTDNIARARELLAAANLTTSPPTPQSIPPSLLVHAVAVAWSSLRCLRAVQRHGNSRQLQRAGSGSTPHDRRRASRLAPSIASASSRPSEHDRHARATSPVRPRPMRTPRSRASPPSKTSAATASAENTKSRGLPPPRSPAVRDPQIPIGALAKRSQYLPAVSSLGGFRAPAPGPVPPSQTAGTRNPSPKQRFSV